MDIVVTLICNPAAAAIDEAAVAQARKAAPAGLSAVRVATLSAGVACDIHLTGDYADPQGLAERIRATLAPAPVDVAVQPVEGRRKRLIVADMDSTIIEQECIDEIADFAGKRAEISAITERAMRGELDFESALKARVAMLKGLPESVLEETFRKRISLTPGARTLVRTMKKHGARAALVSGGFTFFTSRVAAAAGFDYNDANTLLVEGGALTGAVAEPIRGRAAKESALMQFARDYSISLEDTMAVGDGANDLAMLARAGVGVAYRAKPAVAEAADIRIDHGDLTALLYLQGYRDSDFAR